MSTPIESVELPEPLYPSDPPVPPVPPVPPGPPGLPGPHEPSESKGAAQAATRVAIVGGGYAGMAAAVTLGESGITSMVFETGRVLGGRARRVEYRGEILDNGQHILSGAYSELLRLMKRVGVAETAVSRVPLTLSIPPHFSLTAPHWIAPLHLAWALLTAKGLKLSERIAAVRFMLALKRMDFRVNAADTVEMLLAEYRQPEKLTQCLWQPLTISALNTPIALASAQVFVNVLRDALASTQAASDLLLPQTDLSALFPDAASCWLLAQGNEIRHGVRVKSVLADNQRFLIHTDAGNLTFDAVIIAIAPHQFDSLTLPVGCAPTTAFTYEPIVTIYLKFDSRLRLPEPMLGQIDGMVQWFFDRRQLGSTAAKVDSAAAKGSRDDGLIAAVISASGPHESLSQELLVERVLAELSNHTGPLPSLAWNKVITEKFATFACTPRIQGLRPTVITNTPGIFLSGDYTAGNYPATLEGAVRSGINAAASATAHLKATSSASNVDHNDSR